MEENTAMQEIHKLREAHYELTKDMSNAELINEVRALRNEVVLLRSEAQATAIHTSRTAKILDRNTEQDAFKTKVVA